MKMSIPPYATPLVAAILLLPAILIYRSELVSGKRKALWVSAVFLSWFAYVTFVLATAKTRDDGSKPAE